MGRKKEAKLWLGKAKTFTSAKMAGGKDVTSNPAPQKAVSYGDIYMEKATTTSNRN